MASKKNLPKNGKIKLFMRNPLHNHPLLHKGSAHKKTNKAIRCKEKTAMKKEWLPQSMLSKVCFGESFLLT